MLRADALPPSSPRSYIIPFEKQHAPDLMYDVGVMPSRGTARTAAVRAAISAVAVVVTARGVKRASKSIFPLSEERRVREPSERRGRGDN